MVDLYLNRVTIIIDLELRLCAATEAGDSRYRHRINYYRCFGSDSRCRSE